MTEGELSVHVSIRVPSNANAKVNKRNLSFFDQPYLEPIRAQPGAPLPHDTQLRTAQDRHIIAHNPLVSSTKHHRLGRRPQTSILRCRNLSSPNNIVIITIQTCLQRLVAWCAGARFPSGYRPFSTLWTFISGSRRKSKASIGTRPLSVLGSV